jgi:hypothetical protein
MKASDLLRSLFLALLISDAHGQVHTGTVVVPGRFENLEGENGSGVLNLGPVRYQQVYAASEFSAISPSGTYINGILFRPDGGQGHTFGVTVRDIEVHLSTTQRSPDGLSPVFAENIGLDDMIVRSGSFYIQSHGSIGGTIFDTYIFLPTPFYYNPSAGNLLLDIHYRSGEPTTAFDATQIVGDSVSSVWSRSPNSPTATIVWTSGLITEFAFIPEPGTRALLVSGLVCLGLYGGRLFKARN